MKLLIVDDEPIILSHLQESAKKWGYQLLAATNGRAAWDLLEKISEPIIVLVDWVMPEMDGMELCRKIRACQKTKHHRYVIMLTVRSDKEDIAAGLDAGADDYLTKPVHLKELQSRLAAGRRILEYQYMLEQLTQELINANRELQRMVDVDGLTGIANRRYFEKRYMEEWRRAAREKYPLSMILLDIDYFKKYNDTYGHLKGDQCLKKVADILADTVSRGGDVVARYGGEEFAVLLPNTDGVGASVVAEALRASVSGMNIEHVGSPLKTLTLSAGIATIWPYRDDHPAKLIDRADRALYSAKAAGRNNVRQSA